MSLTVSWGFVQALMYVIFSALFFGIYFSALLFVQALIYVDSIYVFLFYFLMGISSPRVQNNDLEVNDMSFFRLKTGKGN